MIFFAPPPDPRCAYYTCVLVGLPGDNLCLPQIIMQSTLWKNTIYEYYWNLHTSSCFQRFISRIKSLEILKWSAASVIIWAMFTPHSVLHSPLFSSSVTKFFKCPESPDSELRVHCICLRCHTEHFLSMRWSTAFHVFFQANINWQSLMILKIWLAI